MLWKNRFSFSLVTLALGAVIGYLSAASRVEQAVHASPPAAQPESTQLSAVTNPSANDKQRLDSHKPSGHCDRRQSRQETQFLHHLG